MNQRNPAPKKNRNKTDFFNIPFILALIVLAIAVNMFFSWYLKDDNQESQAQIKQQAIEQAQQAVRQKLGDSLTVAFSKQVDVQLRTDSLYEVSSQSVVTARNGEPRNRSWLVTLQYEAASPNEATRWKVLSCNIGQ